MMDSRMQQTPLFANNGLHPKFDIQNVNNVMNLVVEDRAVWLTDIQA
jgi:gluconate kinase